MQRYRLAVTVGFTSFATLLFELTQTRILSYIFWNHIVYLTVSLALLGFGISGTLVALLASRRSMFSTRILGLLLIGFGLSSFVAIALTSRILPKLDMAGWSSLLFCYIVYVVPFIFAGAILTIILSSSVENSGSLDSIDLLSAGLGCILFFFLLPFLGAPTRAVLARGVGQGGYDTLLVVDGTIAPTRGGSERAHRRALRTAIRSRS